MPPSKKTIRLNAEILGEYLTGNFTMQELADTYKKPLPTIQSIVKAARDKLIPDENNMQTVKTAVTKKMEQRITEHLERKITLGESMMEKAQENVSDIEIKDAAQLSTLAKTGSEIASKGYGIKDEDSKITAIQINFSVPLNLGSEILGDKLNTQDNQKSEVITTISQIEEIKE